MNLNPFLLVGKGPIISDEIVSKIFLKGILIKGIFLAPGLNFLHISQLFIKFLISRNKFFHSYLPAIARNVAVIPLCPHWL
ncbi:hypothetical protein GVAV_003242 [Gurleya vavrai]